MIRLSNRVNTRTDVIHLLLDLTLQCVRLSSQEKFIVISRTPFTLSPQDLGRLE